MEEIEVRHGDRTKRESHYSPRFCLTLRVQSDDWTDRPAGIGNRPPQQPKPGRSRDEDDDLKRAIEASKRDSMNDDDRRRARNQE